MFIPYPDPDFPPSRIRIQGSKKDRIRIHNTATSKSAIHSEAVFKSNCRLSDCSGGCRRLGLKLSQDFLNKFWWNSRPQKFEGSLLVATTFDHFSSLRIHLNRVPFFTVFSIFCTVCGVDLFHEYLLLQSAPRFSRRPKCSLELTVVRFLTCHMWY